MDHPRDATRQLSVTFLFIAEIGNDDKVEEIFVAVSPNQIVTRGAPI